MFVLRKLLKLLLLPVAFGFFTNYCGMMSGQNYNLIPFKHMEQIDSCQLSLIALSERDAYIEGFKLGMRMATEIYADTQQRG